jgi:hypothetical protein
MAFASLVVMFAVSQQNFLGLAGTEDSCVLLIDILSVYGIHIRSEIAHKTATLPQNRLQISSNVFLQFLRHRAFVSQSRKNSLNRAGANAV